MLSAKEGNHCYHFLTSLVWRGLLSEIEPWTSRTGSEHSTTRLSRQWDYDNIICHFYGATSDTLTLLPFILDVCIQSDIVTPLPYVLSQTLRRTRSKAGTSTRIY